MGASPSLLYLFFPRSPHACYYYDTLQYVTQKRKEDERQKLLNQASIPKPSADLMGNTRATCAYTLIVCKKGGMCSGTRLHILFACALTVDSPISG